MTRSISASPAEFDGELTPNAIHLLTRHLPEPDAGFRTRSADLSLYRVKERYDPDWRFPALKTLVGEARRSYSRYGEVPLFDSLDEKSEVYLGRAVYEDKNTSSRVEEWLTARFIPGDGVPLGYPDILHSCCKGRTMAATLRTALFGDRDDYLSRLVSVSRVGVITPYVVGSRGAEWYPKRSLRHGPALYYLTYRFALAKSLNWDYITGLAKPKMLSHCFTITLDNGERLPTFTQGHEVLGLASPRDIRLDRSVEAYAYPGFFLNLKQLTAAIENLIERNILTKDTLRHYLDSETLALPPDDGTANRHAKWYGNLGRMLTTEGRLEGATVTGETLRAHLDQFVEDEPVFHILERQRWEAEIRAALESLRGDSYEGHHAAIVGGYSSLSRQAVAR